MSGRHNFNWN